jgi:RNA polymerase sigma-70 factor (ECF subfamily)
MTGLESLVDLAPWVGPVALLLLGMVRGPTPTDPLSTDLGMVEAVRNGDATAYRGLVEKYQGRVYNVVYGMVRDQEDARDITQDTFIKAFRSLHTFREDSQFYTWLYRIAMNQAIDFTRRRGRGALPGAEEDVAFRHPGDLASDPQNADGPRKVAERQQMMDAILLALDTLPEDQKQVILLRELEGLSYKEIAAVLDIAEGTVMSRLFYARKKLVAWLTERGITP